MAFETMQTGCLTGGIKRSSGVNALPNVAESWEEVRDDSNPSIDWIIAGYDGKSKTDITLLHKGNGGVEGCATELPENVPLFGGCKLRQNGRFVTWFYNEDEGTSVMAKGRASMHKNGVLNVLEGSDCEIEMKRGLTEEGIALPVVSDAGPTTAAPSTSSNEPDPSTKSPAPQAAVPTFDDTEYIPYSMIRNTNDVSQLPPAVDPLNREQSLSNDEFQQVFGMTKTDFQTLAAWKRTKLKKEKQLF